MRQPDRLRVLEADYGRARHPAERRARGIRARRRRPQGRLLLRGRRRALRAARAAAGPRAARGARHPVLAAPGPLQPREHLRLQGGRRRRQQLGLGLPPGLGERGIVSGHAGPRGGQLGLPGGLRADPQYCGRHGLGHGFLYSGAPQRPLPEEARVHVLRVPQLGGGPVGRGGAALQLRADAEAAGRERGLRRGAGQHGPEPHRDG
mmetsp:Transcript_14615/g.43654  ORF Transcript_14615/g.43654 Transcript_14615/m.43654 type:complete len:206 (+) Transcript_14615:115-732(+)